MPIWCCIAFILGVAFRSWIAIDFFYSYLLLLVSCGAFFVLRKNRRAITAVFCLGLFVLGMMRFSAHQIFVPGSIGGYNGKTTAVQGRVLKQPDARGTTVRYVVGELVVGEIAGASQRVSGKILLTNRLYPEFSYGDTVLFRCKLSAPLPFNGFLYDAYLAKDGIYSLCRYPSNIGKAQTRPLTGWKFVKGYFFKIKGSFISRLNAVLPSPASALASGILIGDTSGIPDDLMEAFRATGVIHIVAVSGYNVSIIVVAFMLAAPYFFISRRAAWFIAVPAIIGFVVMTGAESSAVRAGIMALIAGAAAVSGRVGAVWRILVFTAAIMLLINPYVLRFDVGFQLSFLATLGLIYITPRIDKYVSSFIGHFPFFRYGRNFFAIIRESFSTTVGANIAVAPVIFLQFGTFSFLSPIVNVLILWAIPWIMGYSFIAAIAAYASPVLGNIISWFAWGFLEYLITVVRWFN